ncbi:MAG: cyanoexosortase B system-associated protein [Cyanothece sp. SIO1E1]|nr:cyanoexosortase B system-associated protein [Cyanothece sp. SIO1E1]
MVFVPQSFKRIEVIRIGLLLLLLVMLVMGAIPSYLTGQWPWMHQPKVTSIKQLQTLQQEGLSLPDWTTVQQQIMQIGNNKWSVQEMEWQGTPSQANQSDKIILLLLPQTWHTNRPQVEWMDINGAQNWTVDSRRRVRFAADRSDAISAQPPIQIEARFLRGWNRQQTYAVLQWYAWPHGGNPAPGPWFWVDQRSQWRDRQRTPWVAVSLLIPIKPLGKIEPYIDFAKSLGQTIQSALISGPLAAADGSL